MIVDVLGQLARRKIRVKHALTDRTLGVPRVVRRETRVDVLLLLLPAPRWIERHVTDHTMSQTLVARRRQRTRLHSYQLFVFNRLSEFRGSRVCIDICGTGRHMRGRSLPPYSVRSNTTHARRPTQLTGYRRVEGRSSAWTRLRTDVSRVLVCHNTRRGEYGVFRDFVDCGSFSGEGGCSVRSALLFRVERVDVRRVVVLLGLRRVRDRAVGVDTL